MVNSQEISCGSCMWPVPPEAWNREEGFVCPRCSERVHVTVFPALTRGGAAGLPPERVQSDTEAACFFHPQNRAASPCDLCGRFVCRLCEIQADSKIFCPECFASAFKANKINEVDKNRTMYDSVALALSTLPGIFVWPVLFTGPSTIFITIKYWKARGGIIPRTRVRYYLAIMCALAEMTALGFVIWALTKIPFRTLGNP